MEEVIRGVRVADINWPLDLNRNIPRYTTYVTYRI